MKNTREHEIFTAFLKNGKNRITPERFLVLDAALAYEGHFGADELYIEMRNNNVNVSRATVYNTLELVSQCGLIAKRNFGDNRTCYERKFGEENHDHVVCTNCGKITEFHSDKIKEVIDEICGGLDFDFNFESYSFNIYGSCKEPKNCSKSPNFDDDN